ncbi:MAG: phytanoyl-CoA dioxygenase family protein [Planctomycetes bacterium]|nr:phytanoyl-CoA dioxygenase family protein [Planctomycetota bacterium]
MLTAEQKKFYDDNGYLVLRGLFPAAEIADMRRDLFATLAKPWTGSKRLGIGYQKDAAGKDPVNPLGASFVMHSPVMGDRWFKLTLDWRLVEPMVDLLGPDVNLHDQKMPLKPPGHVTNQGWHQDWAYEQHDVPELAAILLYLDATAPGAGATKLAPGSHKRGEIPHLKPDTLAITDDLITEPTVQPNMNPGDAIIIHTLLAHSVGDNHSAETKSMIAHVYKSARAIDTHNNTRVMAEMPVARGGKPAMKLMW